MFLSLSTAGMGALGATLCHPIAAVKPTSGSLFLLTDDGTVLAVNLNLTSGAVVGRFKSTMPGYPSDIAYGTVGSQEMLFIGSTWVVGNAVFGSVQAFTTDGRPIRSWATKHTVSGLAFDGTKQMVYFTSGDTPEVYAISPQSNADPRYVGEVPGGQTLGTIAVDSVTQHLYISDLKQGAVFSMDLNTKRIA
jgi:sugar lactone lactonase YvrE